MVTEKFISILKNPAILQQEETQALKNLIEEYPYFQPARSLYLKGLKMQNSFKYNNELKVTAAYTTDRAILFDFITAPRFNTLPKTVNQDKTKTVALIEKPVSEIAPSNFEMHEPLSFSASEKHSFSEWLQLSKATPIVRASLKKENPITKTSIIDRFIEKNPKIKPVIREKSINVLVSKNETSNALMTETLAKVYLAQKKYVEAENAFQKAVDLEPKQRWYWNGLYDVHYQTRNFYKSIAIVEKLVNFDANMKEDLVSLYMNTQQFDKAKIVIDDIESKGTLTKAMESYQMQIQSMQKGTKPNVNDLVEAIKNNPKA